MKLTAPILKLITHQVSRGNPLWGLALANEYLHTDDPLHRAITLSAKRRLATAGDSPLLLQLVQGTRRGELPESLALSIGPRVSDTQKRVQHLPSTCALHHRRRRNGVLLRRPLDASVGRHHEAAFEGKRERASSIQAVSPLNRSL